MCWVACVVLGVGSIVTSYALLGLYDDAAMAGNDEAFFTQENLSLGFSGTAAMIGGSVIIALPMIFGSSTYGMRCSGALTVLGFSILAICWLLIPEGDFWGDFWSAMDFGDLENQLSDKCTKYSNTFSDIKNAIRSSTRPNLSNAQDNLSPEADNDNSHESAESPPNPDPDPPPDPPPKNESSHAAPPCNTQGSDDNPSLVGCADTRTRRLGEHEHLSPIQLASLCVLGISGVMLAIIFYALFMVHRLAQLPAHSKWTVHKN